MSGMAGIATPATTGSSSFDLGYDGTTNTGIYRDLCQDMIMIEAIDVPPI